MVKTEVKSVKIDQTYVLSARMWPVGHKWHSSVLQWVGDRKPIFKNFKKTPFYTARPAEKGVQLAALSPCPELKHKLSQLSETCHRMLRSPHWLTRCIPFSLCRRDEVSVIYILKIYLVFEVIPFLGETFIMEFSISAFEGILLIDFGLQLIAAVRRWASATHRRACIMKRILTAIYIS